MKTTGIREVCLPRMSISRAQYRIRYNAKEVRWSNALVSNVTQYGGDGCSRAVDGRGQQRWMLLMVESEQRRRDKDRTDGAQWLGEYYVR